VAGLQERVTSAAAELVATALQVRGDQVAVSLGMLLRFVQGCRVSKLLLGDCSLEAGCLVFYMGCCAGATHNLEQLWQGADVS